MRKNLGWILVCFALIGGVLFADIPIDKSLLDANASRYKAMLSRLEKAPDPDPLQASLQKALLKRLITLSQSQILPQNDPLLHLLKMRPRRLDEFRQLFEALLAAQERLLSLEKEIRKRRQELTELANELKKPKKYKRDPETLRLQYLYTYRLLQQKKQERQALETTLEGLPDRILKSLKYLRFDPKSLHEEISRNDERIQTLQRNARNLELERERLQLSGYDGKELQQVLKGLEGIRKARNDLIGRQLENLALLYALALKEKSEAAFRYQKQIIDFLGRMDYPPGIASRLETLFLQLNRRRLGMAAILKSATDEELRHSTKLFWEKINAPIFTLGNTELSLFKIIVALLIFLAGYLIGWLYKRSINRIDTQNLTPGTRTLLANIGFYLIVIVAFFSTLRFLGISLTSIALVAGALSVGIGFGLQNIVSNFVSGIILMFERSIKIGDYIELDDGLSGYVTDVRMRSVTITTNGNIDIIVPNQQLIQNRVVNWTMNDKIRRFEIPFGVAYGTPVERVVQVVMEAVGRSDFQEIYTSKERQTQVIMTEMADSSVNFKLFVWIKGPKALRPLRTTSRFLTLIYTALNEAGIQIPFPQRDLHLRSVETPLPVVITDESPKKENEAKS
ncbi:mechanosensitive ion channel domain-containing protein [Nitratifractor sp.]